ncbi:hypothetical protein A2U01_0034113, partial [Trifolium medium]|nr:hypothetical protein [Trifolium medium]
VELKLPIDRACAELSVWCAGYDRDRI